MAPYQFQPVKSLNESSGGQRFVFKNFEQRVSQIEIDVFRNLDHLKTQPSEGSSFFRESLLYWRELNTAEDFISFYEETMPWVQTLPQILLYKDTIVSKLLCRLRMQSKLSLEPILRLIASLSRDLLEDFLPFLQKIVDSFGDLLKNGGDREPEILEQVFTSWSLIMMHLQKYLTRDIANVMKVSVRLRYYPKHYVQDFMAEAVAFLLRNAPMQQLRKGVRKVIHEAVKKPLSPRKYGASALLWHVMRGTSLKFHSRAKEVFELLMDKFIMHSGDDFTQGSDTIIEVISVALERACEELPAGELTLILDCSEQMCKRVDSGDLLHLSRLLSFVVAVVKYSKGKKVSEFKPILEFVEWLIQRYVVTSSTKVEGYCDELLDRVLQLMLHLLDAPQIINDLTLISSIVQQWEPVFKLKNLRLLKFMKVLLEKDLSVLYPLTGPIVRAANDLMETSSEEVIYLLLIFFERLQGKLHFFNISNSYGISDENFSRILSFFQENLSHWIRRITELATDETLLNISIHNSDFAVLWGVLFCYPYFVNSQTDSSLIVKLVDALDQLLLIESETISGIEKPAWQSLVGAALAAYQKVLCRTGAVLIERSYFVSRSMSYKSSQQVLCAVADFLEFTFRSTCGNESMPTLDPELDVIKRDDALRVFAENLSAPKKEIRISTLQILRHFEPLDHELDSTDDHDPKKLKTEGSQQDISCSNVIQLLHSIETTPLSVFTSRQADIQISRIERGLSAARISKTDIPITLYGILGIFHNRFAQLWDPALKCLASLLGNYTGLVWDIFIRYLEKCQQDFDASRDQVETLALECPDNLNDLTKKFSSFLSPLSESTPSSTIIILLLQSLQREKVPSIVQSRSRQLLPLFFKFMGYTSGDISSVSHFQSHACEGKEWRLVLKEWLNLLKLMRDPKSLYQSCALKEVLIYRLLDDLDADVQLKVFDCLLTWKDDFLLPYDQNLRNLITSKNLREELTTWTLSRDSSHVQEKHRGHLIPLVIRILIPKIRNLKTLASRKHAGVQHRRAVLCFLAQLDLDELPLFFSLLLKPLNPVGHEYEDFEKHIWCSYEAFASEYLNSNLVRTFNIENINSLSWKRRSGFLHVTEDILSTFDGFHIKPFLNLLMLFVVRILESCKISLVSAKCSGPSVAENLSAGHAEKSIGGADKTFTKNIGVKQFKDLRSLCLKIISFVLNKYESHDFSTQFWDTFFVSVKPLLDSFKQEGSSSGKPSSLFSCFLAMSRSSFLVSLLAREEHLVSSIFSILTVKTASNAIVTSVLSFIENLLYLDGDVESHEGSGIKRILLPNLEALIFNLHCLFTRGKGESRKIVTWPGKTELNIFLLLSKYIKKPLDAQYFTDIMLPFLSKKGLSKEECIEGLHVIQGMLPVVGLEAVGKILAALAPLLVFAEQDIRLCICDVLDGLAVKNPSLDFLANLMRNLNAVSTEEIGEFDYDARVKAYEKITPELFFMLKEDSALVILSHCIYDMSSEELILRQSASKSLLSFVKFSAVLLGHEEASQQNMVSHGTICGNGQLETDVGWARTSILRVVNKLLLKYVGEAMTKSISVQKEWLDVLRFMILNLPTVPTLNSFKPLCSDDAEIDFFNNILHLQKHRRAKALSRFRNVVLAGSLSETIIVKVFVPLFFDMLFEVKDGKGEQVRDACLDCLASISCTMQWETYHLLLIRCFREIRLKPDKQKILVRLICSILDEFHYSQGQKDCVDSNEFSHDTPVVPHDIQTTLQKSLLPEIQKLLSSDSEKVIANISVAALKLLKLLPQDVMESQLPSIIQRISNFFKNRLESVRDEARSALAACVKMLGPAYLHFIVKVLQSTLRRGYELHVLGYTLNFILSQMATDFLSGKLDYCLEEILVVAVNDILGDVAEEKEVEKIASKMKETRQSKSFDTLKLMAQSITFKSHAVKLLSPVKSCLDKHLTQKVKTKVDCMLHHIALGIECNLSVDPTDLFVFAYGLIEDGINGENSQGSHLITVFALGVLNNRLKRMKFDKKDDKLLSLLDPLIGLLGNCLKSKYEDIVSTALKCFTPLMKLPLPSFKYQAKDIKKFLLDCIQRSGNASNPLTYTCLKLLAVLLQSDKVTLSDGQLKDLVQFLSVEIESSSALVALSLLKSIVGRRLVVNEIYDLVKRVGELMVRSQSEPIRIKCSQILLRFLLDYPLHDKRLQQHLDFLLENLSYVHPSGREAVLEMIHAVLQKFPKEMLTVNASNFFFKLILCLTNENDNEVCRMVGTAIKLLIKRISKQALHVIIDASLIWYSNEKPKSWSTGAQALGLLVEAQDKDFQNYVKEILQAACRVLTSAAYIVADNAEEISTEDKIPLWKESYYTLIMLEKVLLQFQDLFFEKNLEGIWDLVCKFLLHPHMRLRDISSRLVFMYFTKVFKAKSNRDNLNFHTRYLMEPSKLFPIAVSLCCQLRSKLMEETHAKIITKNLAFAFRGIHSFLLLRNDLSPHEFWSTLSPFERDEFLKAFEALGSRRGTEAFFLSVSGCQNAQVGSDNLRSMLARPLLKKMGKAALHMEDVQTRVVFNCFRKISKRIGREGCSVYGVQLLDPLYRVCEGFAGKEMSDETKQLAAKVRDSIRKVLGVETFVQIYNQIRKSLKGKRDRRKQQIKLMTVMNPMRHAKRKLRIAEKHRANKRRKIVKMIERRR